ncbi:MAG: alpha/beta fold hydrolase [Candidatus Kerfeldbacteria bacterium]|nr:alpha/beta fold hydrolase [Candidatus Kerfeldbacteria bacterium]
MAAFSPTTTPLNPWLVTVVVIVFLLVVIPLLGLYTATHPEKIISTGTPRDLGLDYEDVSFATADGLTLRGWFIPGREGTQPKTIIGLHGYPADKGDILPSLAFLHDQYALLLFDFRGLGQSERAISTVGLRETEDLVAAIRYLRQRGIDQVGVWGFSMGGAVALMIAPRSPEIKAAVADSSYARLDLLAHALYRFPILKYPLGWLTARYASVFLEVDPAVRSPLRAAKSLTKPVLLIHSQRDEVIPFDHARRLQTALRHNAQAEFWFPQHLTHGELDPEYRQRLLKFFAANL